MKAEVTSTDSASRLPLLLLLFSGLAWLVVGGALALLASLQLHDPSFMAHCPVLTYGRTSAMAETAFVYGWLANAGLALVLWMLGRLAGEPLRAQGWAVGGALFWNLGVTAAVVGLAAGDLTGFPLLELPAYVQLILFFSYAFIAVSGILAWAGRMRETSFASQWYAVAALFLFPWILSIAHIMLFTVPARGVVQAIVAGWYGQSVWTLWLAPMVLSVAYYVVPKVTGRVLPSYEFAALGFWTLVLIGGLTGGRHLVGGPVPAWIPSLAVVSCALLLFHIFIVVLNLRGAFTGRGAAVKFIAFGLVAYALGSVVDALTSFHAVAEHTQFTYFDEAQKQLALYAAASMIVFGGVYFALPRITGRAWYSGKLIALHFGLSALGIIVLLASLAIGSLGQSRDLLDPKVGFAEITQHAAPWLLGAGIGQAILLLASVLLLANAYLSSCWILKLSEPASFNPPAPAEALLS